VVCLTFFAFGSGGGGGGLLAAGFDDAVKPAVTLRMALIPVKGLEAGSEGAGGAGAAGAAGEGKTEEGEGAGRAGGAVAGI
jgi:hypothetical protein